jgi:hypothetical protein
MTHKHDDMTHPHDENCDCGNGMMINSITEKWATLCSKIFLDHKIDKDSPIYEKTIALFHDIQKAEIELMAYLNNRLFELVKEHEMHLIKTGKEAVH